MKKAGGIVLITVVVIIMLISIMATAVIGILSNQALLIEHEIRRIQAMYVAEAGWVRNFTALLTGESIEDITEDELTAKTEATVPGPNATTQYQTTVEY